MSAQGKLLRLLDRHGYELSEANGISTYQLPGCRNIVMWPNSSEYAIGGMTQIIDEDTRDRDIEETGEVVRARSAWAQAEVIRLALVAADKVRSKPQLLGGLGAELTDSEVDLIVDRAEQIAADGRAWTRLVRNRMESA